MELTGERFLPLTRERVWEALNDPGVLRLSVPGCESLERVDDTHYKVVMAAAVGPVKARFNGKLTLTDLRAPESYSLTFEGSGGAAGFGKGNAQVGLEQDGDGTRLVYRATAQVGGRLAQVGARLIDGVAKKMAEDFFARFTRALEVPEANETADAANDADTAAGTSSANGASRASSAQAAPAVAAQTARSGASRLWLWGLVVVLVVGYAAYRLH